MALDIKELKKGGFLKQKQKDYFIVRMRVPAGKITAEKLIKIAEISNKYGKGEVHCTIRQGIEIPWINYRDMDAVRKELNEGNVSIASCGPRSRAVVACSGNSLCSYGLVNTQDAALELDKQFFGIDLPHKLKIAFAGCPNSCSHAQENDIGFMGGVLPDIKQETCGGCGLCAEICKEKAISMLQEKPVLDLKKCNYCGDCINACPSVSWQPARSGYSVFLGGKFGRHPMLGFKMADFLSKEELAAVVRRTIDFFHREGKKGERLGDLIKRTGAERVKEEIIHGA